MPVVRNVYRAAAATLLALVLVAFDASGGAAQQDCANADIRIDSTRYADSIDASAICAAAAPWAGDGFRVLIYLTDFAPAGESDWFAHLDEVESQAGLRDLSQADSFDRSGLAFEATTANAAYGYSITYGERLYDTPLDNDQATAGVKNAMRAAIVAGDPTGAFVTALERAYATYKPPPSATARALSTIARVLLVGVPLALVALVVAVAVVIPAVRRRNAVARQRRHLETLQTRVANLLLAGDQLLGGRTAEETALYQLFHAYGGHRYEDLDASVRAWLHSSQDALHDAFALRQQLLDPGAAAQRHLEQQIRDWEMLYVTLTGTTPRIRDLTDEELHTLLDPVLVLIPEVAGDQLAQQLDRVRREIAGMPLRVDLTTVKPESVDSEGVLGYIDKVKAEIARLQQARIRAPGALNDATEARREAGGEVPSPFVMTETQLLARVDEHLARATAALEEGLFLRAEDEANQAIAGAAAARALTAAFRDDRRRLDEAARLTAAGFRPAGLTEATVAVQGLFAAAATAIARGDFAAAPAAIEAAARDSAAVLARAKAWPELQQRNAASLQRLKQESARLARYLTEQAEPAQQALQRYARGNWDDVAGNLDQARLLLTRIDREQAPQAERLNTMTLQRFDQAEALLAQAAADAVRAERLLAAVPARLAEVRSAEATAGEAARQAGLEIARTIEFHGREDAKIGPEVEAQLQQAQGQMTQAQRLLQAGELLAATSLLAGARKLAADAQAAANAQVRQANEVQAAVSQAATDASRRVNHIIATAQALPSAVQEADTRAAVQQAAASLAQAQQSWAAAATLEDARLVGGLQAALTAYQRVARAADEAGRLLSRDRQREERRLAPPPIFMDFGGPWGGSGRPRRPGGGWSGGSSSSSRPSSSGTSHRPSSFGSSSRPSSGGGSRRSGSMGGSRRR
ncbi:MAG: hypothetical protein ACYC5O_21250 [Anaerolineae bacterium]